MCQFKELESSFFLLGLHSNVFLHGRGIWKQNPSEKYFTKSFCIAFHPFLYVHPPCSLIWLGLVLLMWGVFFFGSAVAGKMSTVDTLRRDFTSPDISNICAVQRGE